MILPEKSAIFRNHANGGAGPPRPRRPRTKPGRSKSRLTVDAMPPARCGNQERSNSTNGLSACEGAAWTTCPPPDAPPTPRGGTPRDSDEVAAGPALGAGDAPGPHAVGRTPPSRLPPPPFPARLRCRERMAKARPNQAPSTAQSRSHAFSCDTVQEFGQRRDPAAAAADAVLTFRQFDAGRPCAIGRRVPAGRRGRHSRPSLPRSFR